MNFCKKEIMHELFWNLQPNLYPRCVSHAVLLFILGCVIITIMDDIFDIGQIISFENHPMGLSYRGGKNIFQHGNFTGLFHGAIVYLRH